MILAALFKIVVIAFEPILGGIDPAVPRIARRGIEGDRKPG
jgi:hypothetical protein